MVNGTDFERGKSPDEDIAEIKAKHHIAENEWVFMFVGRMIWHKNTRIIIDALKIVRDAGIKFKMIFVGDALFPGGNDYPAEQAGVVSIRVRDPNESKRVIEAIVACLKGVQPA